MGVVGAFAKAGAAAGALTGIALIASLYNRCRGPIEALVASIRKQGVGIRDTFQGIATAGKMLAAIIVIYLAIKKLGFKTTLRLAGVLAIVFKEQVGDFIGSILMIFFPSAAENLASCAYVNMWNELQKEKDQKPTAQANILRNKARKAKAQTPETPEPDTELSLFSALKFVLTTAFNVTEAVASVLLSSVKGMLTGIKKGLTPDNVIALLTDTFHTIIHLGWRLFKPSANHVSKSRRSIAEAWSKEASDYLRLCALRKRPEIPKTFEENVRSHTPDASDDHVLYLWSSDLLTRGDQLISTLGHFRDLHNTVSRLHLELKRAVTSRIDSAVVASADRAQPAAVFIVGPAGIGKSYLMQNLIQAVLSQLLTAEEKKGRSSAQLRRDHCHAKSPEPYFNNFNPKSHICIQIDDIFQTVPVAGDGDDDYNLIIRLVNTAPCCLPMADVESKGKIFAAPRFLMCTSNALTITNTATAVIVSPEAVIRRFSQTYALELKPEFALHNGRLDTEKFDALVTKEKRFIFEAYTFRKHDLRTGSTHCEVPFGEVVSQLIRTIKFNEESHARGLSFCDGGDEYVREQCRQADIAYEMSHITPETIVPLGPGPSSAQVALCKPPVLEVPTPQMGFINSAKWLFNRNRHNNQEFELDWVQVAIVASTVAIMALNGPIAAFLEARVEKPTVQSNQPTMIKFGPRRPVIARVARNVNGTPVEETPVMQVGVSEASETAILANTYTGSVNGDTFGYITFVNDRCAMFPNHFNSHITKAAKEAPELISTPITFINMLTKITFEVSVQSFLSNPKVVNEDADLCVMKFATARLHKDITKYVVREKDLQGLTRPLVQLSLTASFGISTDISRASVQKQLHVASIVRAIVRGWKYDADTKLGDCGSPLMLRNHPTLNERVYLGFHIAGTPSRREGYSTAITAETLSSMLETFKITQPQAGVLDLNPKIDHIPCDRLPVDGQGFAPFSSVGKPVFCASETKLFRTPLEPWSDIAHAPAALRPFKSPDGIVNPMVNAVTPYSGPAKSFDCELLAQARHDVYNKISSELPRSAARVYSFEEAVAGIEGDACISGLPRGTSAGFPWTVNGDMNKRKMFGREGPYTFASGATEVKARVEKIISDAKLGVRNEHVFVDTLKDELRSHEKVATGATRLISAAPVDYTIAWRQYFLGFQSEMQRRRISVCSCVGINVYTEWATLAEQLGSGKDPIIAGDFKKFDASQMPQVMLEILRIINDWYDDGPENALVREILFEEVVNSLHLGGTDNVKDILYHWTKSLPSGHPMTSIINSIYNMILFAMCWRISAPAPLTDKFFDCVNLFVYGDDNIQSFSSSFLPFWNYSTVADAMSKFHMTFTVEDKHTDVHSITHKNLADCTFLSRGFYCIDGKYCKTEWLAPLAIDTVLGIPYWCRDRANMDFIMKANLDTTLRELSLHTPTVWDRYAPHIISSYEGYSPHIKPAIELTQFAQRKAALTADSLWAVPQDHMYISQAFIATDDSTPYMDHA